MTQWTLYKHTAYTRDVHMHIYVTHPISDCAKLGHGQFASRQATGAGQSPTNSIVGNSYQTT